MGDRWGRRAAGGESFPCRPLLLREDLLSRGTKDEKRERIPRPRDLSSALPAGTIGLAGAQFLLRNRKHPWMDQARSEPVPLMSFSKNYQSWVKSRPSSPVNTINSNG